MNPMNWLFGPPTQDQFAEALIAAFRRAGDTRQHTYDKSAFRLKASEGNEINLGNLYVEHCQLPRHARKAQIDHVVQIFLQARDELPEEFSEARTHLRPKIWTRATYAELELRQRLNGGQPFDTPLYPLGSHLVTTVVYDLPTSMRSLSNSDLEKWGVSYYEAMEAARENLTESSIAFSSIGDRFYSAVSGDSYDSSRILLKDRVVAWNVDGDHVAMVPQRDAMYVTGSDDDLGLRIMIDLAEATLKDNLRPLSPVPLKLVDDEWEDWTFPKSHEHYPKYQQLEIQFLSGLYADQKALLDAIHQKEGTDIFVASFSVLQNKTTGSLSSYCAWARNCVALLPKTDLIALQSTEGSFICEWDRVIRFADNVLELVDDLYPARYRVSLHPTDEQLKRIGTVEL